MSKADCLRAALRRLDDETSLLDADRIIKSCAKYLGSSAVPAYLLIRTRYTLIKRAGMWNIVEGGGQGSLVQVVYMNYRTLKAFGLKVKMPFKMWQLPPQSDLATMPGRVEFRKVGDSYELTYSPTRLIRVLRGKDIENEWSRAIEDVGRLVQRLALLYEEVGEEDEEGDEDEEERAE